MTYTLYQILWIFIIYAFLGWCTEVVFEASLHGKFINRGFLNGPVCPIYGFGVVLIVVLLTPLAAQVGLLFLGAVLLTSTLEFLTGFLLEKLFGDKWWDYSKEPFNIKGYVCLRFSLLWGLACVMVMETLQPLIMKLIALLPQRLGWTLLSLFFALLMADAAITLAATLKLKKRLRVMSEMGERLHALGDKLGEPLAAGAIGLKDKLGEEKQAWQTKLTEERQALEGLREKYGKLSRESGWVEKRLLEAFPRLQNGKHSEAAKRLRQAWLERKKRS